MTKTSKPSADVKKPAASAPAPKKPAASAATPTKKGKALDDAALDKVAGGAAGGRRAGSGG